MVQLVNSEQRAAGNDPGWIGTVRQDTRRERARGRGGHGPGQAQDPIGSENVQNQDCATDGYDDHALEVVNAETLLEERPEGPGLHLMARHDLEAAIGHCNPGFGGDWEDGGATSREEAVRIKMLSRYRDDPDALWRKHLVADDHVLTRLRDLAAGAGNMEHALELVRRAAVISRHTGTPLRIPPMVLVGPPGTGKSRIASKIAATLGTTSTTINGTSIQDCGPLLGYGSAWRGAGIGAVAKSLLSCPMTSPVVIVDEAEKVRSIEQRDCPLDCLLPLLESTTATSFRDSYLDLPMRSEGIIWIFCANSLDGLSKPLLDRCVVIDVPELSGDARRRALEELVADTVLDHGVAPADLDDESLAVLDGIGLRRARAVVTAALAGALEAGRDWPMSADFQAAAALLGGGAVKPRRHAVGFMHF